MLTHIKKPQDHAKSIDQTKNLPDLDTFEFEDKRPSTQVQRKLQQLANQSAQTQQLKKVQAMANRSGTSPDQIVQRVVSVKVHNVRDVYNDRIDTFIGQLNDAVEKARLYVLNVPTLGTYADQDGHTLHWVDTWNNYVRTGDAPLINAAFGYAVETIATMIYLGDAPAGLSYTTQVPRGGTRPDVILSDETTGQDVAWLDITSNHPASVRHIINDKVLWEQQNHYAEVAYEALTVSDLVGMKEAPGVFDDNIDKEQFWNKRQFGKYLHAERRKHWEEIGEKYFSKPLMTRGEEIVRKPANKADIISRLSAHFKIALDEKMAASVLYAMNIGREKFGLDASVSRNYGESLLLNNDPNLPVMTMPKFGIPQHVGMGQEELARLQQLDMAHQASILPSPVVPKENALTLFHPPAPQPFEFAPLRGAQGFAPFTGFPQMPTFPQFPFFGAQAPFFNFNIPPFEASSVNTLVPADSKPEPKEDLSFILSLGKSLRMHLMDKVLDIDQLYSIEQFIRKQGKGRRHKIKVLKALLGNKKGGLFVLESNLKSQSIKMKRLKHTSQRQERASDHFDFAPVPQMDFGLPSLPSHEEGLEEDIDASQSYHVIGFMIEDDRGNRDTTLTLNLT